MTLQTLQPEMHSFSVGLQCLNKIQVLCKNAFLLPWLKIARIVHLDPTYIRLHYHIISFKEDYSEPAHVAFFEEWDEDVFMQHIGFIG